MASLVYFDYDKKLPYGSFLSLRHKSDRLEDRMKKVEDKMGIKSE